MRHRYFQLGGNKLGRPRKPLTPVGDTPTMKIHQEAAAPLKALGTHTPITPVDNAGGGNFEGPAKKRVRRPKSRR